MADSWEDWDDDAVLPVASKAPAAAFDDEDEQQGFDGFVRHQPLQALADLHPYYAAKHNDEPTVRIMKRRAPVGASTDPSAPVRLLAFLGALLHFFVLRIKYLISCTNC